MATTISATVSSNFLPIPTSETCRILTILCICCWNADVSGSLHSRTALPVSLGGGEDPGLINSTQSAAPALRHNLLEWFSCGWCIFLKSFSQSVKPITSHVLPSLTWNSWVQFARLLCLRRAAAFSAFLPVQGFLSFHFNIFLLHLASHFRKA